MKVVLILGLATLTYAHSNSINKRVLPTNCNCDPDSEICRKGDWVAESIAACEYVRSILHPLSCDAQNAVPYSWTVDTAVGDRCITSIFSGMRFTCGAPGTNTRCVCSDTNPFYSGCGSRFNKCRCQYWPPEDVGAHRPAFCTGYYVGGTSDISGNGVHHWACCNNCDDPTPNVTCDAKTWQDGSSSSVNYCSSCGKSTRGGRVKYYFNCGSCDDQQACANRCDSGDSDNPGFCWKWLDCFKGCCLLTTSQPRDHKRDVSDLSFCGDGVCLGTETPASCAVDCCYQMNSENCTQGINNCSPKCCRAPNCCLENNNNNNNSGISKGAKIGIAVAVPCTFFAILSLIISVCKILLDTVELQSECEDACCYPKLS